MITIDIQSIRNYGEELVEHLQLLQCANAQRDETALIELPESILQELRKDSELIGFMERVTVIRSHIYREYGQINKVTDHEQKAYTYVLILRQLYAQRLAHNALLQLREEWFDRQTATAEGLHSDES